LEIRLRDPSLLPELARHFERSGFRVEQLEEAIEVAKRLGVSLGLQEVPARPAIYSRAV
jgi:hypothetical protein